MRIYILKGRQTVPVSFLRWAVWFEELDELCIVAKTRIGTATVLTVFVGLDCGSDSGPPMIFETMVTNGSMDGECTKYSSWEQAERGHQMTIEQLCDCHEDVPMRRAG